MYLFFHNQVAEMEIENLKESIANEKTKYSEIETQLNEFKANCTCCKVDNIKSDPEDCSSVSLVQPHNSEQEVEYSFPEFLLPCMKISEVFIYAISLLVHLKYVRQELIFWMGCKVTVSNNC